MIVKRAVLSNGTPKGFSKTSGGFGFCLASNSRAGVPMGVFQNSPRWRGRDAGAVRGEGTQAVGRLAGRGRVGVARRRRLGQDDDRGARRLGNGSGAVFGQRHRLVAGFEVVVAAAEGARADRRRGGGPEVLRFRL